MGDMATVTSLIQNGADVNFMDRVNFTNRYLYSICIYKAVGSCTASTALAVPHFCFFLFLMEGLIEHRC